MSQKIFEIACLSRKKLPGIFTNHLVRCFIKIKLSYYFIFFTIVSFFTGLLVRYIISYPDHDKIIKMNEYELNILNTDRNLLLSPQQSGSNLVFDSFFQKDYFSLDKNKTIKSQYNLILRSHASRQKQKLSFDFTFPPSYVVTSGPRDENEKWLVLIFTNISLYNKPEGFLNLKHYDTIRIPLQLEINRQDLNISVELALMVSNRISHYSPRLVHYQFKCVQDIPAGSSLPEYIDFPFKDFNLDPYYQPTLSLSRVRELEEIRLSDPNYRGYLFQFQIKLILSSSKDQFSHFVSGRIDLGNPIIFQSRNNHFFSQRQFLGGGIGVAIFLLTWLLFLFFKNINSKLLKQKLLQSYIKGKENEIRELKLEIVQNFSANILEQKESNSYLQWVLESDQQTQWKGMIKNDQPDRDFINTDFFKKVKSEINKKTIILIIDYDLKRNSIQNSLIYYYAAARTEKFPCIKVTCKSYWVYLLAFLIYTPQGFFRMNRLEYKNVMFNDFIDNSTSTPCLRIPQNNNDLGIDNEKYLEMARRYEMDKIIAVNRKQKEQTISYSLNRQVDYMLFIHSKLINYSPFTIKDTSIMDYNRNWFKEE